MINKDSYVDKHDEEEIDFGLEKIYKLLNIMGNPQDALKIIHIAGTNGKGSVSSYLAYILSYSGLKIGKISSPVIFSKMEFAQIYKFKKENNIKDIRKKKHLEIDTDICIYDGDEYQFNKLVDMYRLDIEEIKPSGYELQIALSLKYFREELCDIVIVETGMGGLLDATNVFKNTLCDVITSISLDHVGMIGNNLEEIALCKCGIITKEGNVVTTSSNENIMKIIQDSCKKANSKLIIANLDRVNNVQLELNNNTFDYILEKYENKKHLLYENKHNNGIKYKLQMNGRHQVENAIIAIEVVDILNSKGYNISLDSIKAGLSNVVQKARFDVISKTTTRGFGNTTIIADGAHNVAGAKSLVNGINDYIDKENSKIIYVISMFKDKEYREVISQLISNADEIWTFETYNPRCLKSCLLYDEVLKQVSKQDKEIVVKNIGLIDDIKANIENNLKDTKITYVDGLNNIKSNYNKENVVVCAGSLSFMKDIYGRLI